MPCLCTVTRGEAAECEAEDASEEDGWFDCPCCNARCLIKASDLIVLAFAATRSNQAAPPLCDCEEGPAKVHCGICNLNFCDGCDAVTHAKGTRKAHVRIPIEEHLRGLRGGGDGATANREVVMCPIHKTQPLAYF